MGLFNRNSPSPSANTQSTVARATHRFLFQVFWRTAGVAILVVVAAVFILFAGFRRISVNEITAEITDSLFLREEILSSLYSWAVPSLTGLLDDPLVKSAVYGGQHTVVDLVDAVQRLQHMAGNNPLIHSLYVYNPNAELVLSTLSGVEREIVTDPDLVEVIQRVDTTGSVQFMPRTIDFRPGYIPAPRGGTGRKERVLTMVFHDRQFHRGPEEGSLVANLSEERLRTMFMEETDDVASRLIVANREGIALTHFDPERFASQVIRDTPLEPIVDDGARTSSGMVEWDGTEHLVVAVTDPVSGRRLISITDAKGLTAAIADLRNTMLVVLIIGIVIAIPSSFFIARQVSRPVYRIVEQAAALLPTDGSDEHVPPIDEFEYLDGVLKYFGRRVAELWNFVEERRQSGHGDALRHCIDGTGNPDELIEELPPTLRDAGGYVVAVVRFDGYRNLIEAVDGRMIRSMQRTIGEMVLDSFDTPGAYVDLGGDHGAIVHAIEDDTLSMPRAATIYETILGRIYNTMERSVTIGIGNAVASLHELSVAYSQARTASDYRFRFGPGNVIPYASIESSNEEYRFPQEVVRHLLEMLRLGKTETAIEMMNRVMEQVKAATVDDFQFALQMLVRMTRRELLDKIPAGIATDRTLRNIVDELSRVDSANEAAATFRSAFRSFGESMDIDREQRVQTIVYRVKSIVEEMMADPNLSVDLIAERVGLSTNYLRDVFKNATGVSISTLILDKKVGLAKQLLLSTDSSVKGIAESSGFQSYNYFFTAFKRSTGMTPRQYRIHHGTTDDGTDEA